MRANPKERPKEMPGATGEPNVASDLHQTFATPDRLIILALRFVAKHTPYKAYDVQGGVSAAVN